MKRMIIISLLAVLLILSVVLIVKVKTISSGNEYKPSKEKFSELNKKKIILKGNRYYFGKAWKEYNNGSYIVCISGSPYEMGFQHGVLLKEEIHNGVVPVFGYPVKHMLDYKNKSEFVQDIIQLILDFLIFGPLEKNTPVEYLQELKGIADGSGIDYKVLFRATFKSEFTMIMLPKLVMSKVKTLKISGECTSIAVFGNATQNGMFIIGRNTDYAGQGKWIPYQTIFIYKPEKGIRYVNVSTAGLIKCNTAINEKGIFIGGHFMGFEHTSYKGMSFTVLQHEIMRKATTIDDVLSIIKSKPCAGSFGYLIADSKNKQAVIIEANNRTVGIHRMHGNKLILTNFALTDELKKYDLLTKYNMITRDLVGRYNRLEHLVQSNFGNITPAKVAQFMGDRIDWVTGSERATGITIGAANNVTSAIIVPNDGLIWIASNTEPACDGEYIGYDIVSFFDDRCKNIGMLRPYSWKQEYKKRGLFYFMKAYCGFEENPGNISVIINHLYKAIEHDPSESIYYRVLASVLIHDKKYKKASEIITKCINFKQSNNEQAYTFLLAGQSFDLMYERNKAIECYSNVIKLYKKYGNDVKTGINAIIVGYAKRYIENPFNEKQLSEIPISFHCESGLE
ncbi:MAG: C45 family autoproteolytic acyltransferase/hydrolase [Spirochaetes bacterium]|nr:C45 family autoproteolytic acyltransferase/hydrolase [Spirochaetota bacterium]